MHCKNCGSRIIRFVIAFDNTDDILDIGSTKYVILKYGASGYLLCTETEFVGGRPTHQDYHLVNPVCETCGSANIDRSIKGETK